MDEIRFTRDHAKWIHTERGAPTDVTVNGRSWDVVKHPTLALTPALLSEVLDLQRATLTVLQRHDIVHLEGRP